MRFKILLSALIILSIFIFFGIPFIFNSDTESINKNNSYIFSNASSIAQVIFFIIVATITILSYQQAKKNLFAPIKTEIFKMQIKTFEDILVFFQNKSDYNFSKQFDYDRILSINSLVLMDAYINLFFKDKFKIDEEKRKEMKKDFIGAIIKKEHAEKYLIKPEYYRKNNNEEDIEITNPALQLNEWKNYVHGVIEYSKNYFKEKEKLRGFISSPLVPSELKTLLENFERKVENNLSLIGEILTDISKEFPSKFKTVESIKEYDTSGIWNIFNEKTEKLEIDAKKILDYIKEYLKIEEIIK